MQEHSEVFHRNWRTRHRRDVPPVVNFSFSSLWMSPLFLPHARTALRGAAEGIFGKRSARLVSAWCKPLAIGRTAEREIVKDIFTKRCWRLCVKRGANAARS